MIADIINSRHAHLLERQTQRLRKSIHTPDVHNIRLKVGDGIAQGPIVVLFQVLQLAEAEPGMPVVAMDAKIAMNVRLVCRLRI